MKRFTVHNTNRNQEGFYFVFDRFHGRNIAIRLTLTEALEICSAKNNEVSRMSVGDAVQYCR
jgi:hypothetical protein